MWENSFDPYYLSDMLSLLLIAPARDPTRAAFLEAVRVEYRRLARA